MGRGPVADRRLSGSEREGCPAPRPGLPHRCRSMGRVFMIRTSLSPWSGWPARSPSLDLVNPGGTYSPSELICREYNNDVAWVEGSHGHERSDRAMSCAWDQGPYTLKMPAPLRPPPYATAPPPSSHCPASHGQ